MTDHAPSTATASAAQIRGARAMLSWSQDELADRAGVARRSIATLEKGEPVGATVQTRVQGALEGAGISFIAPGAGSGLIYVPVPSPEAE